jgi:hypothetical protein
VFGPECQHELAAGIPGSQLVIIDGAGHNPQDEQTGEVIGVLRTFLAGRQRLLEMVWRQVSAATLTVADAGIWEGGSRWLASLVRSRSTRRSTRCSIWSPTSATS